MRLILPYHKKSGFKLLPQSSKILTYIGRDDNEVDIREILHLKSLRNALVNGDYLCESAFNNRSSKNLMPNRNQKKKDENGKILFLWKKTSINSYRHSTPFEHMTFQEKVTIHECYSAIVMQKTVNHLWINFLESEHKILIHCSYLNLTTATWRSLTSLVSS